VLFILDYQSYQTKQLDCILNYYSKNILMELCARNQVTLDGLVNGAYGIFEDYTKAFSKSFI
jgi:hypothetical protein